MVERTASPRSPLQTQKPTLDATLLIDGRGAPQEAPDRRRIYWRQIYWNGRERRSAHSGGFRKAERPRHPLHAVQTSSRGVERASQEGQAFPQRGHRAFVAFEFERDVAAIIHFAKDGGDSLVVEVERVINAAAVIRLGLHEGRPRGQLRQLFVRLFEKIPRV